MSEASDNYEKAKKITRMLLELDSAIFDGVMKAIPDDYHVYPENDEAVTKYEIAFGWLLGKIEAIK